MLKFLWEGKCLEKTLPLIPQSPHCLFLSIFSAFSLERWTHAAHVLVQHQIRQASALGRYQTLKITVLETLFLIQNGQNHIFPWAAWFLQHLFSKPWVGAIEDAGDG